MLFHRRSDAECNVDKFEIEEVSLEIVSGYCPFDEVR